MLLQCLFSWLYYCNLALLNQGPDAFDASMLVFLALLLQLVCGASSQELENLLQCLFSWLYYCNYLNLTADNTYYVLQCLFSWLYYCN